MKMKSTDFDALHDAIRESFPNAGRDFLSWKDNYKAGGYSDMRFRWDCLHLSRFNTRPFYTYLHDNHIDTALKRIVKLLEGDNNDD